MTANDHEEHAGAERARHALSAVRVRVLLFLYRSGGPRYVGEVARAIGTAKASVPRIFDDFREAGWTVETWKYDTRDSRRLTQRRRYAELTDAGVAGLREALAHFGVPLEALSPSSAPSSAYELCVLLRDACHRNGLTATGAAQRVAEVFTLSVDDAARVVVLATALGWGGSSV